MALPGLRKAARAWPRMHSVRMYLHRHPTGPPGSLHPCPGPTDTHAQSLTRALEALISFRSRVFPPRGKTRLGLCMCKNRMEKGHQGSENVGIDWHEVLICYKGWPMTAFGAHGVGLVVGYFWIRKPERLFGHAGPLRHGIARCTAAARAGAELCEYRSSRDNDDVLITGAGRSIRIPRD